MNKVHAFSFTIQLMKFWQIHKNLYQYLNFLLCLECGFRRHFLLFGIPNAIMKVHSGFRRKCFF